MAPAIRTANRHAALGALLTVNPVIVPLHVGQSTMAVGEAPSTELTHIVQFLES